jgi:threonine/homoserine/homoserine lactone efflux protein
LLPQFIAPGDPPMLRIIQLALLFDLIGLSWLLVYSTMLGALSAVLSRPGPRRAMRWLTGTILVGLGVRVALDRT